jgi:hypothetical protein
MEAKSSYRSRKHLKYTHIALDYRATTQLYPNYMFYSIAGYTRYIAGYTMYIPCIYQTKVSCQCGPALSLSFGSLRQGLPSDLLGFGHREAAHARLGQSKVPKPRRDGCQTILQ